MKDSENKQNKGNLKNQKSRRLSIFADFDLWDFISGLFRSNRETNTNTLKNSKDSNTKQNKGFFEIILDFFKKLINIFSA